MNKETVERLAAMIEAHLSPENKRERQPKIRLVNKENIRRELPSIPKEFVLDSPTRIFMCTRIRDLARMYSLEWLVRQETKSWDGNLDTMDDHSLSSLLGKMDKARECRVEGIGFDEAGLVSVTDSFN